MKWGNQLAFGISILVTVIFLATVFSGLDKFNALADDQKRYSDLFNFGIAAAMGFTVLAFLAGVLFGLWQLVSNLKSSIRGLIGGAVMVALVIIATMMSSDDTTGPLATTITKYTISPGLSKAISGSIVAAGIMSAVAFLAAVLGEVRGFFK